MRRTIALAVWLVLLAPVSGWARVTLTASRTSTFFSGDDEPDCSTFHRLSNEELPLHVVRLTATGVNARDPSAVRYLWSLPKPEVGQLVADLDLGPTEQTAAIRGLCAEFGNACILTKDKLPFYGLPTVLWVAPKCDKLPKPSLREFDGAPVRIEVSATEGRRKLGRAKIRLDYGKIAAVKLFAEGESGIGRRTPVPIPGNPIYDAQVDAKGLALPEFKEFFFDGAGGGSVAHVGFAGCRTPGGTCEGTTANLDPNESPRGLMFYETIGESLPTVQARFKDGSNLCDNIKVRVLGADNRARVELSVEPKLKTYVPGDPMKGFVRYKVTLVDQSVPPRGGLAFRGAVLKCETSIEVGKTKDTKVTNFEFRRCAIAGGACDANAECDSDSGDYCLTQNHCSTTLSRLCTADSDCGPPDCLACETGETCIRVLERSTLSTDSGDKVILFETPVPVELKNSFTADAIMTDTWTVTPANADPASTIYKYKLRKAKRTGADVTPKR